MHLQFNLIVNLAILTVLFVIALYDLRFHKIRNIVLVPMLLFGVALHLFTEYGGGVIDILINEALTIAIFGAGFYRHKFGGGDLKLILVIGFYLEWKLFLEFLVFVIGIGVIYALAISIKGIFRVYKSNDMDIRYMSVGSLINLIKSSPSKTLAYGLCVFAGYMIIFVKEMFP
ncbi:MAG: A24 family peptidase [Acetatifactor sp.]|nr:A24 family peptidase [Acetatifactor sp.]